jgi:hypothetical protein
VKYFGPHKMFATMFKNIEYNFSKMKKYRKPMPSILINTKKKKPITNIT